MQTPSSDGATIQIEGLSKLFGSVRAVRDLTLAVDRGEILTFLGPNGAGKTTTIKLLTGLLRPSSGRALIMGHDIQGDPVAAKSHIGYIPDRPYLYEKLTARDFVFLIADLFRVEREVALGYMEEYFDLFGLSGQEDQLIENFSHGMRQKLVFTASFLHSPSVLIVDEPMVGLDPQSARTLKTLLLRKAHEEGMSVFLSTHTLSVAQELADRIGIIHHGQLIFLGSLEEMRSEVGMAGDLEDLFLRLTGERPSGQEIAAD